MLSSRNELIVVGLLIFYIAFIPSLQMVREILATPVGKAAALAGIVYVYKYVSCSAALLLIIIYLRCARSSFEMMTNGNPELDPKVASALNTIKDIQNNIPTTGEPINRALAATGAPINTAPSTSGAGAPIDTTPGVGTVPMTTPTATMPSVPNSNQFGGVQPSMGSSSSPSPL